MSNQPAEPIPGNATLEGTERYAERFEELHPTHFHLCHGLMLSSIGIGTYLGPPTDARDEQYVSAIVEAACHGCNVIDTAINYRFQRSERAIGRALRRLIDLGFSRSELLLCSKAGFIPFDSDMPANPRQWVEDNLITPGVITLDDIGPHGHCMAPGYVRHQLHTSLSNLGVEKLDVYYLHNPEIQLSEMNEEEFYHQLSGAFSALEQEVRAGRLGWYGVATWDGFIAPREGGELLSLEKILKAARETGGEEHHFRFIQLPVNLEMSRAINVPSQDVGDRQMTVLEAASAMNVCAIASASLLQGQLTRNLPVTLQQALQHYPTDAARALQFTRSTPGISTALVGMSSVGHVKANMELASHPLMPDNEYNILFGDR